MKNSLYSVIVVIRIILISITCFLLVWLTMHTIRPATTLFVFILLVFQVINLIYYHNRVVRDLATFLIFLEENDPTLAFSEKRIERSFKGIARHLNKINQKLQHARLEREKQFQYLQMVVKQIDTGIIAWDQDGKFEIFNQAASDLLGIRYCPSFKELSAHNPELAHILLNSASSFSSPVKIAQNQQILVIKVGTIRFDNRTVKLISMQNIKPEIEAGELEAWRKLIRIQRHEIINSITPITTLTTAIKRRFYAGNKPREPEDISSEIIHDMLKSVEVIEERSLGLIEFVERFKNLTTIPQLKYSSFSIKSLAERTVTLFSKDRNEEVLRFRIEINPDSLQVYGDENLIEQALINLVKNSVESLSCLRGMITIRAFRNIQHNNTVIEVADNGPGIEPAVMESIFVPSFTTKANGSGIGLSITRQIILLHKGSINVKSGTETVFEITIPNREQ